jgi:hypothetical protein
MAYLVDTSCFIQAKNTWYAFDICPGFWDWIDLEHGRENVFSISRVKTELLVGEDDLSAWAVARGGNFFLPDDPDVIASYNSVVAWANGSTQFTPTAKSEFMRVADPWIVAHALAHRHTVVSHEVLDNNIRARIKIPNACVQFDVPYVNLFELLRAHGARLII